MDNVDRIIRRVNGNMKLEGMPLTQQDKDNIIKCINKEVSYDEMINQITKKYSKMNDNSYGKRF